MRKISFTNEKGNVAVNIRNGIRKQVEAELSNCLSSNFDTVLENEVGGFSIPIAEDRITGDPIYIHVDFAVSNKEKVKAKKASGKAKKTTEVELPDLFPKVEEAEGDIDPDQVEIELE